MKTSSVKLAASRHKATERQRRWREANRERSNGQAKAWRERNPEKARKALYDYRAKHPERIRATRRKSTYGLSAEQFQQMKITQNGVCAICRKPPSGKGRDRELHVDHCHTTGKVRGLLCRCCNNGIGMLGDSPELLRTALAYLER